MCTTQNFLFPATDKSTVLDATSAGGALVAKFAVLLSSQCSGAGIDTRRRLLGSTQPVVLAFGDVSKTGQLLQHWDVRTASISVADVGTRVPVGVPVLNPGDAAVVSSSLLWDLLRCSAVPGGVHEDTRDWA